jgi:hypothetical protein
MIIPEEIFNREAPTVEPGFLFFGLASFERALL